MGVIVLRPFEVYFLNSLLDSVSEAVTGVDKNGVVIYWNSAAEQMYGIPKEQIIGRKIGEFFRKGSIMLFQVMRSGLPVHQVYHNPRPDIHVLINAVPIFDDDGELIGAIAIEQDVTYTVRLSEELFNKSQLEDTQSYENFLVKRNTSMKQIVYFLTQTSDQSFPVLLVGESGVGRETLAHLIHNTNSHSKAFISMNCEAIPTALFDTELFGYQEGILGGSQVERQGKLDMAHEGTLYLKNIHHLPLPTQSKLANAIQERRFYRVGGTTPLPLTCRIVASSSPDLVEKVKEGSFSKELFYLFHQLNVPTLKERKEDLPELCNLFLHDFANKMGKPVPKLSSEVMAILTTYHWPGNLHELRNVMERLVILSDGEEISAEHLPNSIKTHILSDFGDHATALPERLPDRSEKMERKMIEDALRKTAGNKANAARLLGISRGALYYKLKQYNLIGKEI
jgi:PAS domain S-box-containing protein